MMDMTDHAICPYCKKDLSVFSLMGARKHVYKCSQQRHPTYTYRDNPIGRLSYKKPR